MPALAAFPVLAGAIGGMGALSAGSSIMQGIQANTASKYQQEEYNQQAAATRLNYGQQIVSNDWKTMQVDAANTAKAGASGILPSGSPDVVNQQNDTQSKIRDMYTKYSGQSAANQLQYEGSIARWEGKQALLGGIMGAGSDILGAGANIGIMKRGGTGF